MDKSGKLIAVLGATGRQGGAVVKCLLKDGWSVRALVRDPNSPNAKALEKLGATVVICDMDNRPSLDKALKGCYGLFSVQNPWDCGVENEIRQGKCVADAAKAAGIKHTVYTSVACADRHTGIPHFESKQQIEKHLKAISLPATVIRPVFFLENFETTMPPVDRHGTWTLCVPLSASRTMQLIAVDDIGAATAQIFDRPKEYTGKTIELAGDELSMQQIVNLWSRQSGKKMVFEELPIDQVRKKSKELAVMWEWFHKHNFSVDLRALKAQFPFMHSFENWLNSKHGALADTRN